MRLSGTSLTIVVSLAFMGDGANLIESTAAGSHTKSSIKVMRDD